MIKVIISGGLGNQIFQYVYGLSIAINLKQDLYLDISGYEFDDLRDFELDRILDIKKSSIVEVGPLARYVDKLLFKISKYFKRPFLGYVQEISLNFHDIKYEKSKNYIISGYWQNEKYFEKYFLDFVSRLQLPQVGVKNTALLETIKSTNSIGLHVRRGDYELCSKTSALHGGVCNDQYYRQAVSLMRSKAQSDLFVVFSDDITWCKNKFAWIENVIFCDATNSHFEDMLLMSSCKHNIIANSSFSWWSAYLNSNKGKVVIAPNEWFRNMPVESYDIVPDTWLKI